MPPSSFPGSLCPRRRRRPSAPASGSLSTVSKNVTSSAEVGTARAPIPPAPHASKTTRRVSRQPSTQRTPANGMPPAPASGAAGLGSRPRPLAPGSRPGPGPRAGAAGIARPAQPLRGGPQQAPEFPGAGQVGPVPGPEQEVLAFGRGVIPKRPGLIAVPGIRKPVIGIRPGGGLLWVAARRAHPGGQPRQPEPAALPTCANG